VLPFEQAVIQVNLNSRDSVMTNAERLGSIGGGGTNCSAPIQLLNQQKAKANLVIFVSDNESWVDQGRGTGNRVAAEWGEFRQRNPKARLVCLDVQPNETTQAVDREDILNIGGFSDQVFEVISAFATGSSKRTTGSPSGGSCNLKRGPNAGGTTFFQCQRLAESWSALLTVAGECRWEYMAKRVRLPFRATWKLSPTIVASLKHLRRMQEELHGI